MARTWFVLSVLVVMLSACHRGSPSTSSAPKPAANENGEVKVAVGSGRRTEEAAKVHETIEVPAGSFVAGSLPGDEGRDPGAEPIAATYDLPAFRIDALPYPNEPGVAPFVDVSEADASKMCAARGERLCTELEWERACRGPSGDAFASGPSWDPTCADPTNASCVSGFGVRAMGGAIEEWTAGTIDVGTPEKKAFRAIVRGAYPSAPPALHRCAARHALDAHVASKLVGFRCCTGGAPDTTMAPIADYPTFAKGSIAPSRLADLFAATPELARIQSSPRFFRETEIVSLFEKSKPPETTTITVDPVLWSPAPGERILVVTGRSKGGAFVVALHVLPDDRYRLASSLIFANEQGPIVLATQANVRKEIAWSTCWGCAGEGGAVTYRDDRRVVIVQR